MNEAIKILERHLRGLQQDYDAMTKENKDVSNEKVKIDEIYYALKRIKDEP